MTNKKNNKKVIPEKAKVHPSQPKAPKKKKNKRVYFGKEVQDAIIRYNDSNNDMERNKIYQEEIHYAFDKLCENIINTFKFTYFDDVFQDVKTEVVSFLVMNMHKYDHSKGSKAFSYFSVVAKNYLILHNNNNYKKYKTHTEVNDTNLSKSMFGIQHSDKMTEFTLELIKYFEKNIPNMFKKKKDIEVAYSVLELIKERENIENFNKKALYILIREMTDVNTAKITSVINTLKSKFKKLSNEFHTKGHIDIDNKKFF